MVKTKPKSTGNFVPVAAGQLWRVQGLNLQINNVGPFMVQYKVSKPDSPKGANEIQARTDIEKYLKKHKAVLLSP